MMAFDIYGNRLTPGHCEVHPDEFGEYPCELCCADDQYESLAAEYDEMVMREYDEYCALLHFRWAAHEQLTGDDNA